MGNFGVSVVSVRSYPLSNSPLEGARVRSVRALACGLNFMANHESRSGLQLFDLNRYLEDFFKDILNIVYDYKLINLNEERSNNPGL